MQAAKLKSSLWIGSSRKADKIQCPRMLKKDIAQRPCPRALSGGLGMTTGLLSGKVLLYRKILRCGGSAKDVNLKIDEKNKQQTLKHPIFKGVHDLTRCASPPHPLKAGNNTWVIITLN